MKDPSVRGVLCTDTNGALYCSKGSLESAQCSAVVSQLANLAATLEPNSQVFNIKKRLLENYQLVFTIQPVATVLYCAPSASSSIPSSSSPIDSSQQQQNTSNTAGQGIHYPKSKSEPGIIGD
jgi:hypothetical protein